MSTALLHAKFLASFEARTGIDLSGSATRPTGPTGRPTASAWVSCSPAGPAMSGSRLGGLDDTVMPVLDLEEAARHPQNVERGAFVEVDGTVQPAPTPRFGRTPSEVGGVAPRPGQGADAALAGWGSRPRTSPGCGRRAPSAEPCHGRRRRRARWPFSLAGPGPSPA